MPSTVSLSQLRKTQSRTRRLAAAVALLGVLAVSVAVAAFIWMDRQQRLERLQQDSTNLSLSIAMHVGDRLRRVDADLRLWRNEPSNTRSSSSLMGLQWVAADGSLLRGKSTMQPGDAEFGEMMAFHKGNKSDDLLVGSVQHNAADGGQILPVSRAVKSADGSFAGVVIGALSLDDLQALSQRVQVGRQGVIGISDSRGILLARWPHIPGATGRYGLRWESRSWDSLPRGNELRVFSSRSPADGVHRFYAQASAHEHLLITVGSSIDEVLKPWWTRAAQTASLAGAALMLCTVLIIGLRRAGRREAKLRAELEVAVDELKDFRHALDEHAIVCVTDETGSILQANANFCEVMKYPLEELLGRNHRIMHSGVHPRSFFEDIRSEVSAGKTFRGTICDRDRKGNLHWFDLTVIGIRSGAQGPLRMLSVRTDITQSRHSAQALEVELQDARSTNESLAEDAHTDALTGLPNRRAFDAAIIESMRQLSEVQKPAALIMVDVDYFKPYNDSLGHAAGDEALQQVAQALHAGLRRAEDRVFRYGGEEFAVLINGATAEASWRIAQTLRVAVSNLGLPHPKHPLGHVTISLGLRTLSPDKPLADPVAWIASADAALYAAKKEGRNACVVADQSLPDNI